MTYQENQTENIDIVLLWVDGDDPKWQAEYRRHHDEINRDEWAGTNIEEVGGLRRYRDWGTLRYVLRSIETYTPWYNKLYFITSGHLPDWLDLSHPRLICLSHDEFFSDPSHLPTFNSNAIQMNLPNIDGLSEQYIVWDDDILLTKPLKSTDFFNNGLPVKPNYWGYFLGGSPFEKSLRTCYREVCHIYGGILTKAYFRASFALKNPRLWLFNAIVAGLAIIKREPIFPGGYTHMPFTMLKSESKKQLALFSQKTLETSQARFRRPTDMMTWCQNFLHYAQGSFYPSTIRNRVMFLEDHMDDVRDYQQYDRTKHESWLAYRITRALVRKYYCLLCIQDHTTDAVEEGQQERVKSALQAYLQAQLPNVSRFEKNAP